MAQRQKLLIDDYAFIDDHRERFQIIVETAGLQAPAFPDGFRTDANLVEGCLSKVWMTVLIGGGGEVEVCIDSESPALRSIGALFCRIYSGASPEDVVATEPEFLHSLKIDLNLTPTRPRGVSRIRQKLVESISALMERQ